MRDCNSILKSMRICLAVDRDSNCLSECFGCDYINHDDHVMDMIRDAADAIEELLAAVPKWVSVEDEPPKENDRYLVRYKRVVNLGDEETVREDEIRIMRFFVGEGWRYPIICNDHVRLVNEEVTHWMPLPEPPKEETE